MPIVDNEEVLNVTADQLDEIFFNIASGRIFYNSLVKTDYPLFSSKTVAASGSASTNGINVGNCTKLSVTVSQTGASTSNTIFISGSDKADLSLPSVITSLKTGITNPDNLPRVSIDPSAIPAYLFLKCTNNDSVNNAIYSINVAAWK